MLEILAQHGARATFFLVGENVRRWPRVAGEITAEGHDVAVHCNRHVLLPRRRAREVRDDLDRAYETIAEVTGKRPVAYRPPYGVFTRVALAHARERDWTPLLWSTWGRDWERRATPASIARRATRGLGAGGVVLLHDSDAYSSAESWARTAAALPAVLDAIVAVGVPPVSFTQST